jgi:hypothetical protein
MDRTGIFEVFKSCTSVAAVYTVCVLFQFKYIGPYWL